MAVAAATGLRRSELLGLRWSGVDLATGRLAVTCTVVKVNGRTVLRLNVTKSPTSRRSIPIDSHTAALLGQHRVRQLEERLAAGPFWEDHDLVFANEVGMPINPDTFTRRFLRIARANNLPVPKRFGPHALRHGWATVAMQVGVPAKVVAERLGHATVKTTVDTYSHVAPGVGKEAADKVAELIFGK